MDYKWYFWRKNILAVKRWALVFVCPKFVFGVSRHGISFKKF